MVKKIFATQKNNNDVLKRIVMLFVIFIISTMNYSCLKKNDPPPVYAEIPDANFKTYLKTIVPLAFTPDGKFISNHPSVTSYDKLMSINRKGITSLSGIEYFTSLTEIHCNENKLTKINLSKNIALINLHCSYNSLTKLDVSKNINLKRLECYNNKINSVDLSRNLNLEWFNCEMNKLSKLDVGNNIELKRLYCSFNYIIALDVSKNLNLNTLECFRNNLTTLVINKEANFLNLYIDNSIKCCDPSIKRFKDRGGNLFDQYFQEISPFVCE